jgi:hypothetical protein
MVDGREVGFALFFHNFSTFLGRAGLYLEDFTSYPSTVVKVTAKRPCVSSHGFAVEWGCGRLEWWCLME